MRAIALAAVLFLLAVAAGWGSAVAAGTAGSLAVRKGPTGANGPTAPSSHVKTRWRATLATLPANAATGEGQTVSISSISCASRGNCTAVGSYSDNAGDQEGLLLTEKAGHWGTGVEAVVPGNAYSDPQVSLSSVACGSAGSCTAVGTYSSGGIYRPQGLLLTETAGQWAAGVEAVLPPDAASRPGVVIHSVSCASAGNCTAVGSYTNGLTRALLLTEKAGSWKRGVAYGWGSDHADLTSVSCSSDGGCSAVGYSSVYYDFGRDFYAAGSGMLLTKKGGKWRAESLDGAWPADASSESASLTSVSCASAGNCSATGMYGYSVDQSRGPEGALLTEEAGKWQPGVRVRLPRRARPRLYHYARDMAGISCASPGDCGAIGNFYWQDGSGYLMLLTEKAGKWQRGIEPALPRGANASEGAAISCAAPRNCTVVGSYGAAADHGLLLTEIAGRWARGVRPPHLSHSLDSVSSVSCAAPGNCGAVGIDWTSGGPVYGVLLDSTTPSCVVPRLKGKTSRTARHSIEFHNCSFGTLEYAPSQTIEAGHVISQRPRLGRHLPPGTKINLTVSSGP